MFEYTICFCRHGDSILMLYRHRPPNAFLWNGIGGKIEVGETPLAGVSREVVEEAPFSLDHADDVRHTGVVSWPGQGARDEATQGMYVFVARFERLERAWTNDRAIPEGLLSWKPIEWVCDPLNSLVVENIPWFLPAMLDGNEPMHYHCRYGDGRFLGVEIDSLEVEFR